MSEREIQAYLLSRDVVRRVQRDAWRFGDILQRSTARAGRAQATRRPGS